MVQLVDRQRRLGRGNTGFVTDILTEIDARERPSDVPRLNDQLSDRELEVLRYLPTVLNASEIAGELHVSVNTVKAHLRSIYRKLGASRRRDAVIRAREARML
jgi:LuxR family maltose regulon positive regulatory protein